MKGEAIAALTLQSRRMGPSGLPSSGPRARASLSDIGQTVAANFGAKLAHGVSFLPQIL